jgi:hypothetical protein
MELIFEVIEPSGRVHQCRKLSGQQIRIGRAFNNDLILTDPTVDPYHAVIEMTDNGQMLIKDLGSVNGTFGEGKQRIQTEMALNSGSEYLLGKTRIHVFSPDHPVAATAKIGNTENVMDYLGNPLLLTAAFLLTFTLYAGSQWLNMFSGFKWQGIANVSLMIFGSALAITIFWAVIGRILRHESHFWKQATIILVFMIAQFLLSIIYDLVLFNTLDYMFSMAVMILLECVLVAVLLWFNLYLATNQTGAQRLKTAISIALVLMLLSVYSEFLFREDFTETPDYVRVLKPPVYHLGGTISEEEFITNAASVFSKLDAE